MRCIDTGLRSKAAIMRTLHTTIILLLLKASNIPGRRHRDIDDSFENLLVFKDCKYKEKPPETTTPAPPKPVLRSRPTPCSSCCSMCCNMQNSMRNQVGEYDDMAQPMQPDFMPQQSQPAPDVMQSMMDLVTPPNTPVKIKKKKKKNGRIAPFNVEGRRDLGKTREHIKILLSRDEEMKRILRELVRVTIQKVGLLEEMQRRNEYDDDESEDTSD